MLSWFSVMMSQKLLYTVTWLEYCRHKFSLHVNARYSICMLLQLHVWDYIFPKRTINIFRKCFRGLLSWRQKHWLPLCNGHCYRSLIIVITITYYSANDAIFISFVMSHTLNVVMLRILSWFIDVMMSWTLAVIIYLHIIWNAKLKSI